MVTVGAIMLDELAEKRTPMSDAADLECTDDVVEWRGTHSMPWSEFAVLRSRVLDGGRDALSHREHQALIERTAQGDRRAGELLIMLNGGLAWNKAVENKRNRAAFANIDLDELMQEFSVAILHAALKYDQSKGAFSTYLAWWLRAYTTAHNSGDSIIHVSPKLLNSAEARKGLDAQAFAAVRNVVSTETPLGEDGVNTIGSAIPSGDDDPETAYGRAEAEQLHQHMIREALGVLDEREYHIITTRWLTTKTVLLDDIGAKYGISKERVRQIEARAMRKMRAVMEQSADVC